MVRTRMTLPLIAGALLLAGLLMAACSRDAGELRLKHEVTVETAQGERTYGSVVSLTGVQSWGVHPGGSGYGAITGRLTGEAVRIPLGENEFYVLLRDKDRSTPAWSQMELVKGHFGIPNYEKGRGWIGRWKKLAASRASVELRPQDYPQLAVMPAGGWMNDARLISLEEAAELGLTIRGYRLSVTRERPSQALQGRVHYRPTPERFPRIEVGRESFVVKDGTA
jgi:hypothetical protein